MKRIGTVILAIGIVAAAIAGLVDAIVSKEGDFAAVFLLIIVLAGALLLRSVGSRRRLAVRGDLYRWYAQRAAIGGERIERVTDRALAAYRAQLVGEVVNGCDE